MILEPTPSSVRAARSHVRQTLAAGAVDAGVTDTVELLTSEVVTNAVLHAATGCEVEVAVSPDRVRVEILDHSGDIPVRRAPSPDAETGRGLMIVEQLAQAWGFEPVPGDGKLVWFEVAR
jgi:anti-sigma regulatory factor (Ser/Thr protein kinase)